MKRKILLLTVGIFATVFLNANNLRITSGQRVNEAGDDNKVKFSIAWDNSWRVVGEPANWDAVWIFIKYKKCGVNETWKHALLSTTMGDHTIPGNLTCDPILTAARDGSDSNNQYDFTGHNTGIMVYRIDNNKSNIPASEIILTVNGTAAGDKPFKDGQEYEIRVIGIEMVYVPQGQFWLGEDDGICATDPCSSTPFYKRSSKSPISSEAAIPAEYYWDGWSNNDQRLLPASFPKGFKSFYCMKYEITQGQFKNYMETTVPITGDANHPFAKSGQNRNNLATNTTPDRAQNWINWSFLKAYLDWAALRPMTELEYEKACLGPESVRNNGLYAWGTETIIKAQYLTGTEDGTEKVATLNANCNFQQIVSINISPGQRPAGSIDISSHSGWGGLPTYNFEALSAPNCEAAPITSAQHPNLSGANEVFYRDWYMPIMLCGSKTGQGFGPLGAGIFARDNTLTRETTGATYYGIMEMSGNVWEQCINVSDGTANWVPDYTGVWGDGNVNQTTGYSNVSNWDTWNNSRILKGGSWENTVSDNRLKATDRSNWNYQDNAASSTIGGRGVR